MTLSEIKRILEERGMRPLKQFGQNFLHDKNLCACLVQDAMRQIHPPVSTPSPKAGAAAATSAATAPSATSEAPQPKQPDHILEIGPGLGAFTRALLEAGCHVTCIEKDRGMVAFLKEHFAHLSPPQFELMEGDALEVIPALPAETAVYVVGNLPYNISTPLLMTLLSRNPAPEAMLFTLQLEMAQRIVAPHGGKDYGSVSVLIQSLCHVQLIRKLPSGVFYPQPEIESAVLGFRKRRNLQITDEAWPKFAAFVKQGFSQRRKKLSNLLPVKDSRRAEHLSVADWQSLFLETTAQSNGKETAQSEITEQDTDTDAAQD
ncbi:MAG TPA: 16S rRNA (adenine(1518)-N(6)/adenine(1519)-N(6))-dimethyltransferase RsmA [Candidatus Methylacidiphilales bacterium]|nr:16S rRNA (adenine(1518)-N(6)/adenine(1519)-N(6))-dimethyltransferase RsmA [Candidatus Methylacidiphilales bacterium]